MNEIKCPNCGEVFTVNESQYAELISQVRTVEFDKELHARIKQELTLVEQKALNEQQVKLAQKDQEIAQLQSQIQNFDTEKELAKKEVEQSASQSLLEKEKVGINPTFNLRMYLRFCLRRRKVIPSVDHHR